MKATVIAIIAAAMLIFGAIMLARPSSGAEPANNVSLVDGTQVVEVRAKGGYAPAVSLAQANVPTTLQINTQGTYDCSVAFTIPSLSYRTMLPSTGKTLVDIGAQKPGSVIQGTCSMGMYRFEVRFN